MKIEKIEINKLKPAAYNPRQISTKQFKDLKQSIEKFGLVDPIIINENGYVVIGGHQRLKICKELKHKEVGCVILNLNTEQERELNIRLNKNTGEFDFDLLANEFEIEELTDWGFKHIDLGLNIDKITEGNTEDDHIPEVKESRVKLGDVWQLGKHRLMCGDSTKESDVEKLMNGEKAELLHADPPYGMGKEKDGVLNDNLYKEKLDTFQLEWFKTFRPYLDDNGSCYIWGNAEDLWRLWYSLLKDSERLTFRNEIVWNKGHGLGMSSDQHRMFPTVTERCLFFMIGEQGFNNNADNYWEGWDFMVNYLKEEKNKSKLTIKEFKKIAGHSENSGSHWFDKSQWGMPTKEVYNSWKNYCKENNIDAFKKNYEELKKEYEELKKEYEELKKAFYDTRAYFNNTHDNMTDVWNYERVSGKERHNHATPKPVEMMERIIKSSSKEKVIEPFLGSGSTLIACEKTNRICYGMELDTKYCDVIIERWQQFTGQKANKITE
jgi:DNA modification methylase